MTNKTIRNLLILIGVIALFAIPKLMKKDDKKGPQLGAKPSKPVISVSVYDVKTQSIENKISVNGSIYSLNEVELRMETAGKVVKVGFKEGEEVHKGQLLLKVNDSDLQAQLRKATNLKTLKDETEKRYKELLGKGGISQEAYDIAQNDMNSAGADIDLLKEQIRKTEIIAPFDGRIGLSNVSEGSFVNNTSVVANLQNVKQVKVEFSVPEKYAVNIVNGHKISFTTDASSEPYTATIYATEPKIDLITRNFTVRAVADNPDGKLLPGSFVKVTLALHRDKGAIMVPTQAVVPILKGQKVFVVQGDTVVEKKVDMGIRNDSLIEITNGLQDGEKVVIRGVMQMKKGAKVKVEARSYKAE